MVSRRFVLVLITCLAVTLALPLTVSAQEDPASVAKALYYAINRGDLAGALALFADDAVRISSQCPPPAGCVGKDGIGTELARVIGIHQTVTVLSEQVSGDTVTERVEVRNDTTRKLGIDRIIANATYIVRGGKIISQRAVQDTSDPQTAQFVAATAATQASSLPKTGEEQWPIGFLVLVGMACLGVGVGLRRQRSYRGEQKY